MAERLDDSFVVESVGGVGGRLGVGGRGGDHRGTFGGEEQPGGMRLQVEGMR